MRFMILLKANKETEAGVLPSEELLTEMGKFNEELAKAGVLLAGEGLQPSSKGARVKFSGDKRTVVDGPFAETKELIAGFWLWQVKSKEEAIEWVKRCRSEGRAGQVLRGQADRRRRAVRRDQGADRGLLAVAGEVEGRGDRMGQALQIGRARGSSSPGTSGPSSTGRSPRPRS